MAPTTDKKSPLASKTAWGKLAVHTVTCTSGAVVRVRLPNLALLMKLDAVPTRLRDAALRELVGSDGRPQAPDEETVKALYELYEWLVCETVVEPEIVPADLPGLPQEDLEMLIAIATRQRDTDALGVRLGIDRLERWEPFRVLAQRGSDEGCPSCKEILDAIPEAD